MNILIVEDDPNLSLLWNSVFESTGHSVDAVYSAVDARRDLMAKNYDVVLIDCYLGQAASMSVAGLALGNNPDCKVVMVAGSSDQSCHDVYDQCPEISAVLRKPVDIEHLVAVCDHINSARQDNAPTPEIAQSGG